MIKAIILAYLLSLPTYFEDTETKDERFQRMSFIAEDIAEVVNKKPRGWEPLLAAAIIIRIGWEETRFAQYVGEGRCIEGRYKCDPDKDGIPQSRTYYQLKQKSCPTSWTKPEGSRAEHKAAVRCAFRQYVSAYSRCYRTFAGAFSAYRSAATCDWPPAIARAHRLNMAHSRLMNKMANLQNNNK